MIASNINHALVVAQFFMLVIFSRYELPRALVSIGSAHFIEKKFKALHRKYEVHHMVGLARHP